MCAKNFVKAFGPSRVLIARIAAIEIALLSPAI
jgi:hypothetical protein